MNKRIKEDEVAEKAALETAAAAEKIRIEEEEEKTKKPAKRQRVTTNHPTTNIMAVPYANHQQDAIQIKTPLTIQIKRRILFFSMIFRIII